MCLRLRALCHTRPLALRALALGSALLIGLAGCAAPPSVFRADRESDLLTAPPLTTPAGGGVWVGPVAGDLDGGFRRALAAALVARAVPAGTERLGPLSLTLTAAPQPARPDGGGYRAVLWSLHDRDGGEIESFFAAVPLDFRLERPETKAAIAVVADRLARRLAEPDRTPTTVDALVVAAPPAATEGFDDGGPLARAIMAALALKGFQPGSTSVAVAIVKTAARVTPVADDPKTAIVAIRWAVVDAAGQQVGFVDQENVIPVEFTEDGLVAIAADAAAAAAPAIADLVRRAASSDPPHGPSTGKGES